MRVSGGSAPVRPHNAGEACTAANRFYVESSVAEEFSRRLAARMQALVVPGTEESTQVGPLVNEESVRKVDDLVRSAISEGAQALTGGRRPDLPGFYFEPC